MSFSLPVDVTVHRKPLSATSFEYIFRHHTLGELCWLILASSTGVTIVMPVLFAPAGDARNARRKAVFGPLAHTLADQLEKPLRR